MRTLTHDEIIACARGTRQAKQTDLSLELLRFSEAELAYYAYSEGALVRALCTAGVALSFETDSDCLRVVLRLGVSARAYAFIDLYVDDLFVATAGSATAQDTLEASFTLAGETPCEPGHLRRVTLYLPHCRQAGIVAIELADGAACAPYRREELLALGDSITQGMEALHPSLAWPAVAARALNLDLHGCGIGGHHYDAAGLIDCPVARPALITVAYGTNDWNMERSAEHARPYLTRLRELYPTSPLAVLAPPWWEGAEAAEKAGVTLAVWRRTLADIVAEFPVDCYLPMPALLPPGPHFLADGVHPGSAGHLVMGQNVARLVQAAIRV